MARSVRASFVDVLEQDYIRTADAKGLPRHLIVWKHAFKNAASPILIVLGLQITRIVGGVVVVELIFAMPGIGTLAFNSVTRRDIPMMQGVVLIGAILVIVTNLVVEWIVAYLNPRSSHAN
jgi:peptide/nickel transport system permease protein